MDLYEMGRFVEKFRMEDTNTKHSWTQCKFCEEILEEKVVSNESIWFTYKSRQHSCTKGT